MPWSHCGDTIMDDSDRCPRCGISKPAWTLKVDRTRLLKLSGQRFEGDALAQVESLKEAAKDGKPFCEKCQQAWVAFRVTDALGVPLKDEDYKVVFSDGEERTGKTDANGLVQLQDFAAGKLKVVFPNRDRSELEQVAVATRETAVEAAGGEERST
jgi:hypothetical protein